MALSAVVPWRYSRRGLRHERVRSCMYLAPSRSITPDDPTDPPCPVQAARAVIANPVSAVRLRHRRPKHKLPAVSAASGGTRSFGPDEMLWAAVVGGLI